MEQRQDAHIASFRRSDQRDAITATSMATDNLDAQRAQSVAIVQQYTKLETAKETIQTSVQHVVEHTRSQTQGIHCTSKKGNGSLNSRERVESPLLNGYKTTSNTTMECRQAT